MTSSEVRWSVSRAQPGKFAGVNAPDNTTTKNVKVGSYFFFYRIFFFFFAFSLFHHNFSPQWGAADAEIKVPSGENTERKRSPFQAWSRSV